MPTIHCPQCNQEYDLDDSIVGRAVQCAKCDTRFVAQLPRKSRKKWLFIAVGFLLVFVVGKTYYNSRSDSEKKGFALDKEVEIYCGDDAMLHVKEEELLVTKYDSNSLCSLIALRQSIKDSMHRMMAWESDVPKSQAPYDIAPMPYKNEFFDLALREAKSGNYKYLASQGYSDEAIARMIMEKYYLPALLEATDGQDLRTTDALTQEQLEKFRDLQVKRQIAIAEARNPNYKATAADLHNFNEQYIDNMKDIAENADKARFDNIRLFAPVEADKE